MLYSYHKGISKYLLNDGFDDRHYIILYRIFYNTFMWCGGGGDGIFISFSKKII